MRKRSRVKRQEEFNLTENLQRVGLQGWSLACHHTEVRVLFYSVTAQHGFD